MNRATFGWSPSASRSDGSDGPNARSPPLIQRRSTIRMPPSAGRWRRRWATAASRPRHGPDAVARAHGDDPIAMDAALSGLRDREATVLRHCCRPAATQTPQRAAGRHDAGRHDRAKRRSRPFTSVFALMADGARAGRGSVRHCCAARRWRCSARRCRARAERAPPVLAAPTCPVPPVPADARGRAARMRSRGPAIPRIVRSRARTGPAAADPRAGGAHRLAASTGRSGPPRDGRCSRRDVARKARRSGRHRR